MYVNGVPDTLLKMRENRTPSGALIEPLTVTLWGRLNSDVRRLRFSIVPSSTAFEKLEPVMSDVNEIRSRACEYVYAALNSIPSLNRFWSWNVRDVDRSSLTLRFSITSFAKVVTRVAVDLPVVALIVPYRGRPPSPTDAPCTPARFTSWR